MRTRRKVTKKKATKRTVRRKSPFPDGYFEDIEGYHKPRIEGEDALIFAQMLESCGFFVRAPGRRESISKAIWSSKNREIRLNLEFWQIDSGGVGFRIETFDSPPPPGSFYTEGPFRSDPKSSAQFVEKLTKAAESFSKKTT